VLIQALPTGSRARSGLQEEWLTEHELAATLTEVTVNRGRKKTDWLRIPRPSEVERPVSKEEAVDRVRRRMLKLAQLGGG